MRPTCNRTVLFLTPSIHTFLEIVLYAFEMPWGLSWHCFFFICCSLPLAPIWHPAFLKSHSAISGRHCQSIYFSRKRMDSGIVYHQRRGNWNRRPSGNSSSQFPLFPADCQQLQRFYNCLHQKLLEEIATCIVILSIAAQFILVDCVWRCRATNLGCDSIGVRTV